MAVVILIKWVGDVRRTPSHDLAASHRPGLYLKCTLASPFRHLAEQGKRATLTKTWAYSALSQTVNTRALFSCSYI